MKKINVTFSLPPDLHKLLQSTVGRKKMSSFVTQAIKQALEQQKEALKADYMAAQNDPDRKEVLADWNQLDTQEWE